jgi:hypothetical protein
MEQNFQIVDIDQSRTASDVTSLVNAYWKEHGKITVAKLSVPHSSTTLIAQHFSSAQTKSTLAKVHASKYWTKAPTTGTLHAIQQLPLIPLVFPSSKLLMALHPSAEHPAVLNSFEAINMIQHAYQEVKKVSQAQEKHKTAIEKQKDQILSDTLTFTSNTLARLFVRSSQSEILIDMFMREMYYTTVNIVRVFEFSILDLLLLEEKYQTPLVTPLETELSNWKSTCFFAPELVEATMNASFAKYYKMVYGIQFSELDMAGDYPSPAIMQKHLEYSRAVIQDHLFYCGNHEQCGKREMKAKTFAQCSKCKWTRYCSQPCQLSHWKSKHKLECGKLLSESDAEALFKGRRIIIGAEADAVASSSSHAPDAAQTPSTSI